MVSSDIVFARHKRIANGVRAAIKAWGLKLAASSPKWQSDTVSAIWLEPGSKNNPNGKKAIEVINISHGNKIKYIEVHDLDYNEYIKSYDSCHIFLDQVYAYDQGYNALEAMAKGKVVFTGAEKEWLDHYNLIEDSIIMMSWMELII